MDCSPPPPPNSQTKSHFITLWPMCEKLVVIFALVIHMSALDDILLPWNFGFTQAPTQIHIVTYLDLNLKSSYQIASFFPGPQIFVIFLIGHMSSSVMTSALLPLWYPRTPGFHLGPQDIENITFKDQSHCGTYEKLIIIHCFSLLYICLHYDEVFITPWYPWNQLSQAQLWAVD